MFFMLLRRRKKGNVMGRKSKFDASFKAKLALEAVKEQKTLNELAKEFNVSPLKISARKSEFLQNASAAFLVV